MFAETKQKQNNRENRNVKKNFTLTIEIIQTGAWSLQNKESDQKIPKRKTRKSQIKNIPKRKTSTN